VWVEGPSTAETHPRTDLPHTHEQPNTTQVHSPSPKIPIPENKPKTTQGAFPCRVAPCDGFVGLVVLATRGFIGEVTPLPQLVRGALNRPSVGSYGAVPQVRLWSWGKRDFLSQSQKIGRCGPWGDVG
jgi:hypothetical protein